jgi:hypothetical protein
MPYRIKKNKDGSYKVVNRITGKVFSKHTTQLKAKAQVRLLHMKEHKTITSTRPYI